MYDQTNKLWFKAIAFIVMQAFILTLADVSWAANYRENKGSQQMALDSQKIKDERDKLSKDALSNQFVLTQPAMPYMGFEQVTRKGGAEPLSLIDTTISGLSIAGNDLADIFKALKSSGCSVSEAGFGALRQGFNKKEIYHALMKGGYDKEEVKNLLGSLLKAEEEEKEESKNNALQKTGPPQEKPEEKEASKEAIFELPKITDSPVEEKASKIIEKSLNQDALFRQTVEFVRIMINEGKRGKELIDVLKKAGLSNERIITALAQLGFNLKDIINIFKEANISCGDIVQALHKAQIRYSDKEIYGALIKCGYTEEDIITAFRNSGLNGEAILKIATELKRDMVEVAKAMAASGFSKADIARAYILKAMQWTWDRTVNIINCAVKAFDAFLTNIGRKFSSQQDLAYSLIVDDILATGEVVIQGKDVMTSMLAIKNVARQHGIDLQGYNLTLESLLELNGMAVVHLDGDHWVSLVSIDGDNVTIIDNGQKQVISLTEFKFRWDGNTLAIARQKIQEDRLLDMQMREIRGGRGIGSVFKSVAKVFKSVVNAVVEGVKTFVNGMINVIKGSLMMLTGNFKEGFWTMTMGTMQMLCAPTVALYHLLPENVARIIGQVMKVICIAVGTIVGGIIGTFCGGQTQLGMAIGAFVGTIVGYCFDYDMVMACKTSNIEDFKVLFKRMIIEATVNAAVAFCVGHFAKGAQNIQGTLGYTAGQGFAANSVGAAIAGGASGGVWGVISAAATSTAVQTMVVNTAINAVKQTLVSYALTAVTKNIENPYLRAAIIGAGGAWAGSSACNVSFQSGAMEFGKLMTAEIAKSMVVGAVTNLAMESIRQVGYNNNWDPLLMECVALAAGTAAQSIGGAALGFDYKNNSYGQSDFSTRLSNNLMSSLGSLAGAITAKCMERICRESGMSPIFTGALGAFSQSLITGLTNAAIDPTKSFSWTDVSDALFSGLGTMTAMGYKDLLIREFDYTDIKASEAAYNLSVVWDIASTGFGKDVKKDQTYDEFVATLSNTFGSIIQTQVQRQLGFTTGYSSGNAYERMQYIDSYNSEIDSMDYMMHGQGEIKLGADGRYYNADGSINTYWTRNADKTEYWNYWKQEKPEIFGQQAGEGSASTSTNMSFGDAWLSTISARQLSFQNTEARKNFTTGYIAAGAAVYNTYLMYKVDNKINEFNAFRANTGLCALLVDGKVVIELDEAAIAANPALREGAQQELMKYGAGENSDAVIFADADAFLRDKADSYYTNTGNNSQWKTTQKQDVIINGKVVAAQLSSSSYQRLLDPTNAALSNIAVTMDVFNISIFGNISAAEGVKFNASAIVNYNAALGTWEASNPTFQTIDGSGSLDLSMTLDNKDKVYFTVASGSGIPDDPVLMDARTGKEYGKTALSGVAAQLGLSQLTENLGDTQVGVTLDRNGSLILTKESREAVITSLANLPLETKKSLVESIGIDLPNTCDLTKADVTIIDTDFGQQLAVEEKGPDSRAISNVFGRDGSKISTEGNDVSIIYRRDGMAILEGTKKFEVIDPETKVLKVVQGIEIKTPEGKSFVLENGQNSISFQSTFFSSLGLADDKLIINKGSIGYVLADFDTGRPWDEQGKVDFSALKQQGGAGSSDKNRGQESLTFIKGDNGNVWVAAGSKFAFGDNGQFAIADNTAVYNKTGLGISINGKDIGKGGVVVEGNILLENKSISRQLKGYGDVELTATTKCIKNQEGLYTLETIYVDSEGYTAIPVAPGLDGKTVFARIQDGKTYYYGNVNGLKFETEGYGGFKFTGTLHNEATKSANGLYEIKTTTYVDSEGYTAIPVAPGLDGKTVFARIQDG
ncbi:MAG: hypothetical protein KKH34_08785, partial [Candidatus Omnitrophica bacterium]|nr:hypothetical protein [Candidatus Omnitrophota bacterium]